MHDMARDIDDASAGTENVAVRHWPQSIKDRHLMENFFQRIKRFRRIAKRFEKLARNFLAFLFLASSPVWRR